MQASEAAAAGPGQLRKFENYRSRYLPGERTVIVYVPGIYERRPDLHFPVLYMQDGQNLFDPATSFIQGVYWRVGETADRLIAEGAIQPLVIVGIYNTGKRRLREYSPSKDRKLGGGGADRYGLTIRRIAVSNPFWRREHRNCRFIARRFANYLPQSEIPANIRQDRRTVTFGVVESTLDCELRCARARRTEATYVA
jgi:hypothetical protein